MVRPPMQRLELSEHAVEQARRRGIPLEWVLEAARSPDSVLSGQHDREIRQRIYRFPPDNRSFLVRVILELDPTRETVVTVYRTSKIQKYRSRP